MKVKDLIVENKIDEAPMGALKTFGLQSISGVSPTASGKFQSGQMANQLSADFKEYLGKTGQTAEPDIVLAFLKSKGIPTDSAEKIIAAGPDKGMLAKGMDAVKGMFKGKPGEQPQQGQQPQQGKDQSPQPKGRVEPKLDPEQPQQGAEKQPSQKPNFSNQLGGGQQKISTGGTNDPKTFKNVPGQPAPAGGLPSTTDPRTAINKPAGQQAAPQGDATSTAQQPTGRKQGGGKVAGVQSQTPGAQRKRDARAAKAVGNTGSAIDQFVKTQTGSNPVTMKTEPQQNPVPQKQKQPRQRKKPAGKVGDAEWNRNAQPSFGEALEYEYNLLLEALSKGQLDKIFMAAAQDAAKAGVQGVGSKAQGGAQPGGGAQAGASAKGGQQQGAAGAQAGGGGGALGGFARGLMGQDDSEGDGKIKGTLNVNQLAGLMPGVDPKILAQAVTVIRQGREPNRTQMTTLGSAMISIIKADPQTTTKIMALLKRVSAE
jgi:hypothetical protein